MERTFETPKGTKLPIVMLPQKKKDKVTGKWFDLPPKPYVNVPTRIVWFREEHPNYTIRSEIINMGTDSVIMKAQILDETGRLLSEGIKYEDKAGFFDYLEKCESSAIGRALAFLGYGTQYALELEEGEDRLADAPAAEKKEEADQIEAAQKKFHDHVESAKKEMRKSTQDVIKALNRPSIMDLAKFVITFGPNRNKQLQEIDPAQLINNLVKARQWIEGNQQSKDLQSVIEFVEAAQRYLNFSGALKSDDFNDPKKPLPNHAPGAET